MKRKIAVALVALAVVVSMVPGGAVAQLDIGQSTSTAPSSHAQIPGDRINATLPAEAEQRFNITNAELRDRSTDVDGGVRSSAHASTMNATWGVVNEETGKLVDPNAAGGVRENTPLEFVIVVGDDVAHGGRNVSVPTDVIEQVYGYRPVEASGRHSSGDQWSSTVTYEDGFATWHVPKFSTNTITWKSEVNITGSPSVDGSQYQYELNSTDSVSNFTINVAGSDATERDAASAGSLSNGDSFPLGVAGNKNATDVQATLTGNTQQTWANESATGVGTSSTQTINTSGNLDPAGPGPNGNPTLAVSGQPEEVTNPENDGKVRTRMLIGDTASSWAEVSHASPLNGKVTAARVHIAADNGGAADVYLEQGAVDTNVTEGTLVATNWSPSGTGWQTIQFDQPVDTSTWSDSHLGFDTTTAGSSATTIHTDETDDDGNSDYESSGGFSTYEPLTEYVSEVDVTASDGNGASTSFKPGGGTQTEEFNVSQAATDISWSGTGSSITWELKKQDQTASEDPSADVDGDGAADISYAGVLKDNETTNTSVGDLQPGTGNASVSLTSGTVDAEVAYTERTATVDPTVEVNGHVTNYSGELADGSTTSLTANTSWLGSGVNQVNVSVGDGTLSADAPTPQTGLEYRHEASDQRSVQYEAEQWSERYNVSRTYASDQENVQLRIPFQATVHEIRSIKTRTNGGDWTEPGSLTYDTIGNDLVYDAGSVNAGDTVEVRANGSMVKVQNGSVEVYNPSMPGTALDTDIRINSWDGSNSHILVGDSEHGDKVHFARETSYSGPDDHVIVKANGEQQLRLPHASQNSEVRVQTVPITAEPHTGEARIDIDDLDSGEPRFDVSPGGSPGDDVDFTFVDAADGETYELYSMTNDVVHDSGTAQSPLTLTDDDSDETLVFRIDDGTNATGGGGGGGVPMPAGEAAESIFDQLPLLAGGAIVVLTAAILIRRRVGPWAKDRATTNASSDGVVSKITGLIADVMVAFADAVFRLGGAIRGALGSRAGKLALASAVVIGLFAFDIITFTSQERTLLLAVTVLLGTFVGLRRFGQFSWPLFSVITAATIIFGLSAMGTDLLGQLINSPMFPIVGIGGLYLGYKALQSWREGQQTVVQVNSD